MYIYWLILLIVIINAASAFTFIDTIFENVTNTIVPEDAQLNISELVRKYGYPFEEHKVITEDGYHINFHRIPRGKDKTTNNLVIFLMHGIWDSSDTWVLQGVNKSLAYILADEGFDVWMGNARGNKHASKHTNLLSNQSRFWEFSWDEIGYYDLPAMIDYALKESGKDSLYYVGHSQGTTTFFVMASLKPEYNHKVKMMFALAPEAWMGNVKSPLVRMFSPANFILGYLLSNFNTYSPSIEFFNKFSVFVCSVLPIRCDNFIYMFSGQSYKIDEELLPVIFGHMPTGSSTLQFVHFGQLVQSERFCRYDHGSEKNYQIYKNVTAPDYDLSKITVPISIFYSSSDCLSDPIDVEILRNRLPNVFEYNSVECYNHIDYMYAFDARQEVYTKILDQIRFSRSLVEVFDNRVT